MKLTFFLLGSNTARKEIIATPCCVLLVCGKEKTEEHVMLVQKQYAIVGGVMIPPVCTVVIYNKRWLSKPLSSFHFYFYYYFIVFVDASMAKNTMLMIPHFTLSINQKSPPTATSFSSWYSLWGQKILKLCSVEVADLSYFRKSVCLLSSNRPEPISWHVRWTATLAERSACPAVLDRLLKSLWGHKVVLMHL